MAGAKLIWADEVPQSSEVSERELEDFFCACALHIGDPDTIEDIDLSKSQRFTQFFQEYFPKRRQGAFTFIHYIIWYEKESRKVEGSTIRKPILDT